MDDGWLQRSQQRLAGCMLSQFDRLPEHVGIVMDGNRRFAQQRGQARKEGHASGFATMSRLLATAYYAGIAEVTVYAFSIENFNRTPEEVADLMDIARERLKELIAHNGLAKEYGVRINVFGKIELLPEDIQELAHHIMSETRNNTRATLNLCMPYTARDDMATAIARVSAKHASTKHDNCTEEDLRKTMYTSGSRPLDLLVRTSGTYRLSDFLLWETNDNTVIDFVPELWPEYTPWRLFQSVLRWRYRTATKRHN